MRPILHLQPRRTIQEIQREACVKHGVSMEALLGERRDKKIVQARHEAIRSVYSQLQGLSLSRIARAFNRDHTTVLYVVGRVKIGR